VGDQAAQVAASLDAVADLRGVVETADTIPIGAGATYQDALSVLERHYPDFGAPIRRIGSRQIRNRGTTANAMPRRSGIRRRLCLRWI
jgi:xanthine dehydrogenase small subunit